MVKDPMVVEQNHYSEMISHDVEVVEQERVEVIPVGDTYNGDVHNGDNHTYNDHNDTTF
jgi:hypothetical protein